MAEFIGITKRIEQVAQLSKVDSTLTDTELILAISVNQKMKGSIYGLFTEAGAAAGVRFQLLAPAAGTLFQVQLIILDTVTPAANVFAQTASAAITQALAGGAGTYAFEILFSIENGGTAGNVTLQFAQNVTDANATILLPGAYMEAVIH